MVRTRPSSPITKPEPSRSLGSTYRQSCGRPRSRFLLVPRPRPGQRATQVALTLRSRSQHARARDEIQEQVEGSASWVTAHESSLKTCRYRFGLTQNETSSRPEG